MIRNLLRSTGLCCGLAALLSVTAAAPLDGPRVPVVVGAVLPPGDPALQGVQLGAAEAARTAELLRQQFALHVEHGPDPAAAAVRLVRERGAQVIIGGADDDAAARLMDLADSADILFINIGASTDALRARCSPNTLHVAPSTTMRRTAVSIAGVGDTAVAWHDSLERYGAGQVNDRFRARFAAPVGERAWTGWLAVRIAWEAAQRVRSTSADALSAHLIDAAQSFDGHKGLPLSFHPVTRQLRQPLYVLAGDSVVADVPAPRDEPDLDPADLLDRLGTGNGKDSCTAR